jgi:hypothetical protein
MQAVTLVLTLVVTVLVVSRAKSVGLE